MNSQASSVFVGILVDLSDLSDHTRGTVLESGNSSLEDFVANKGPCIAEDLVAITIFKFEFVERGVSHAEFRLLEACRIQLWKEFRITIAEKSSTYIKMRLLGPQKLVRSLIAT